MNNIFDVKGKTALITGASAGLGKRFSQVLSENGCRVILVARRIDKLKELSKTLENARPMYMDISDGASVKNAFSVLDKEEKIDICINNASIAKKTPVFEDDHEESFEEQMNNNVNGTWRVTRAVAKHMKHKRVKGSIINIASVNGSGGVFAKGVCAYSTSKAAIIHLTKSLVAELSQYNIRINCISPGLFKTHERPDLEKIASYNPCGRYAKPKDMDGLILYLASNNASWYVTGSCFVIDGGLSCRGIPS